MHHEEQGEQKSLRCFSCRQRKVRCDRSYPTCGACARLSLSCSWVPQWRFKDQRKFIEERYDMTGSTPSRRTWERLEFVGNTCFPSPPSVSSADDNGSRSSPQSRDLQFQLPVSVDPAPSTRLQMLAVALQHYLPYDEQNYRCQSIEQWPTLNHLNFKNTSLVTATPLVNAAVDAFALAQVAISSMDPRLSLASIRRYNTCLQILRVTLEAETGYRKCDILLSMLVLQAVEVSMLLSFFPSKPAIFCDNTNTQTVYASNSTARRIFYAHTGYGAVPCKRGSAASEQLLRDYTVSTCKTSIHIVESCSRQAHTIRYRRMDLVVTVSPSCH